MDQEQLKQLIDGGETLTVEFKGEGKEALSDRDLVLAVVCLANGQGGRILVGVEDDHRVTGALARHGTKTDRSKLLSLVRGRTVPPVETTVEEVNVGRKTVLVIGVPPSPVVVATSDGSCQRRVMGAKGPE